MSPKQQLMRYVYYYKPTDEQKAKLEKVLTAQQKDLDDFDKTRGAKIKAIDDQIAGVNKKIGELKKEIAALEKHKAVHTNERAELLIDHKAEIENVFTQEQKVTAIVNRIKAESAYRYWAGLPEDIQAALTEKFEAAALKVIQADPAESDGVLRQVRRDMYELVKKTLKPEHRQAGEAKYLLNSTLRRFYRIKLTDEQVARVRELCEKAAKRKAEVYEQYRKIGRDRDTVRKAMQEFGSRAYYYKISDEVTKNILTQEQRSQSRSRRSSRSRGKSSTGRSKASTTKRKS